MDGLVYLLEGPLCNLRDGLVWLPTCGATQALFTLLLWGTIAQNQQRLLQNSTINCQVHLDWTCITQKQREKVRHPSSRRPLARIEPGAPEKQYAMFELQQRFSFVSECMLRQLVGWVDKSSMESDLVTCYWSRLDCTPDCIREEGVASSFRLRDCNNNVPKTYSMVYSTY